MRDCEPFEKEVGRSEACWYYAASHYEGRVSTNCLTACCNMKATRNWVALDLFRKETFDANVYRCV